MNESIRTFSFAQGMARGRVDHANHQHADPAALVITTGLRTGIVQAAHPGYAWWRIVWTRFLYKDMIDAWYRSGYLEGWARAKEAATRARRIIRYRVVTTTSQGA